MMKKTIYKALCIAAMALTMGSCDEFLDIQPTGRVIITTAKEYREMLTQAYSIVPEDRGLATFRSDEFTMDATLSQEDISSFKDI
ncbi:MAG: RagB/SusD family nutrient uptake outer membrane protein, partial [Muribaculaceae bacterium]